MCSSTVLYVLGQSKTKRKFVRDAGENFGLVDGDDFRSRK